MDTDFFRNHESHEKARKRRNNREWTLIFYLKHCRLWPSAVWRTVGTGIPTFWASPLAKRPLLPSLRDLRVLRGQIFLLPPFFLFATISVDSRFPNQFRSRPRSGSGQRPSATTAKAKTHNDTPAAPPIFIGAIAALSSAGATRNAFSTRR